jgi:hypothetical protein
MLHGRLNTKDMMSKKNFFVEFNDCILCDECPQESIMHLFFEYSFSQSFWWAIGIEWNVDMNIHEMISDAKPDTQCSLLWTLSSLDVGVYGIR